MNISLKEAEKRFAELFAEAAQGKEVVIVGEDGVAVKVVPTQQLSSKTRGLIGSGKGWFKIADDFGEPLDFDEIYETGIEPTNS